MSQEVNSIVSQVQQFRDGLVSPVDIAEQALNQAKKVTSLNAFVALNPDYVIEQAQASKTRRQRGKELSAIDGIPIAVKDNFLTCDYPTTACSHANPRAEQKADATIVSRLRAAGAVIMGKTNMHEWAYGATNTDSIFGPTLNPHNRAHITGGSSGGSGAVVAAGIVGAALGSDTGGSVRIPASACGVYGYKPTYGRASRHGVLALSWSLDAPGFLTRSLDDLPLLLPYMLGQDKNDVSTAGAKPFGSIPELVNCRLLHLTGNGLECSKSVDEAIDEALGSLPYSTASYELSDMTSFFSAWEIILHCEASSFHQERLKDNADLFGEVTQAHLLAGEKITGVELLQAQRLRAEFTHRLLNKLPSWDVLVLPTLPVTAPKFDQQTLHFGGRDVSMQDSMTWFCWLGNLAGLPCISIPIANDDQGLPIGMMLMGKPGKDEALIAMAKKIDGIINYTQKVWKSW